MTENSGTTAPPPPRHRYSSEATLGLGTYPLNRSVSQHWRAVRTHAIPCWRLFLHPAAPHRACAYSRPGRMRIARRLVPQDKLNRPDTRVRFAAPLTVPQDFGASLAVSSIGRQGQTPPPAWLIKRRGR